MRHTKIMATLGPASDNDAVIDHLVRAGVDVFRFNFSHGTHDTHSDTYARVRAAAERAGRSVAVLQDLSGPKIRTGRLAGGAPIALRAGDQLEIVTGDMEGVPGRVSTTYAPLARAVRAGDELLLDDGRVVLRVIATDGTEITTTVLHGASLGPHKGINAPGVALPSAGLSEKDQADLRFGLALGVDIVALSFVQSAADLKATRDAMRAAGRAVPLVAKIERPEAVGDLDNILDACDGVMVARGDLGLELPLEQVPRVQREVTCRARARGVPVILATQVLESMRTEPRPTRAEVSDAANAVDEGVDAIMLAGETAAGAFPARAVETLDAIIRDAEMMPPHVVEVTGGTAIYRGHGRALCDAAVTLATHARAAAIVAITPHGNTARVLSSLRPGTPVLAATESEDTARRLTLYRSVQPIVVTYAGDVGATTERVGAALAARGFISAGATVVVVSIADDLSRRFANYVKLHQLS